MKMILKTMVCLAVAFSGTAGAANYSPEKSQASVELINQTKAKCVEACFLINLKSEFKGSEILKNMTKVYSILEI